MFKREAIQRRERVNGVSKEIVDVKCTRVAGAGRAGQVAINAFTQRSWELFGATMVNKFDVEDKLETFELVDLGGNGNGHKANDGSIHNAVRMVQDMNEEADDEEFTYVKMDNPDITMEEYIWLEEEKAQRRGRDFDWKSATYGKVKYFDDVNYFKDFEAEFPAIVFRDALISEPETPSKPTLSSPKGKKIDLNFEISFDESDDEDYTFMYDKN
ncbi:hypothetical protein Tco_0088441 [Tanacetum coccineum]